MNVFRWLDQKPGIGFMSVRIFAILVRYHHVTIRDGWKLQSHLQKTHLKDVAVAPAALARPGGDGSEDTT